MAPVRPDLRLLVPGLAAWAAAAVALRAPPVRVLMVTALALPVLLALLLRVALRRRPQPPPAAAPGSRSRPLLPTGLGLALVAALLCAAGAAAVTALRVHRVTTGLVPGLAARGATVGADLVLTGDPLPRQGIGRADRPAGDLLTVTARTVELQVRGVHATPRVPVLVLVRGDTAPWLALLPGQRLRVQGRLAPARPGDPWAAVLRVNEPPSVRAPPGPVSRGAGALRAGLRKAVDGLPPGERGLIPGLVVGDTSRLPAEVEDDFRTTGLSHLTAVSGANVAIVLGFVLLAGRWAGLRSRTLQVVGVLAIVGFAVLARPQPSVLRASAMGLVAVVALASGRTRLGLPALSGAVLALVLIDPWLARSYGFTLSVLATAGLIVLSGPWTRTLSGWLPARVPTPLAALVAVPAAAQAVCAPIVVLLSEEVSLAAIPANMLVAPAIPPATVLGVLAAVISPLHGGCAAILGQLAGLPARWIVAVARAGASVPGAAVSWPSGRSGAVLLALVTIALVAALGVVGPIAARHRVATASGLIVAFAATVTVPIGPAWPPAGWLIVACDVGQGDALVLAASDAAVVVDAGPDPRAVDRCLDDLGVTRVAALVLTHLHADHVEGLPGVLAGRRVAEVVIGPLDEPADQADRLEGRLAVAGIPLRRAVMGERDTLTGLSFEVVGPSRVVREDSVPNNASLVLLADLRGVRVLLTGDIEVPAQRLLVRKLDVDNDGVADDGAVDILKVPHHGSADQVPELFSLLAPRLALISAGVDNDYGHPAAPTLALLDGTGTLVGRTDQDGDLAVVGNVDDLRLVRRSR